LGSRFCRARHGCRTDINSLAAWCGETTWQIVTVNMFLMFLMFSHLGVDDPQRLILLRCFDPCWNQWVYRWMNG
jgi:hypothetical protein